MEGIVFGWCVGKVGTRLDEEQEENAVHVAQAFHRQIVCERFVAPDGLLVTAGLLNDLRGRFVAQQFDGSAKRELERFGNAVSLLVRIFINAVEKYGAVAVFHAALGEKRGGKRKNAVFTTREELLPVKAQQAVTGELRTVDEKPRARGGKDHPARRIVATEDVLFENLVPVVFKFCRHLAVESGQVFELGSGDMHLKRVEFVVKVDGPAVRQGLKNPKVRLGGLAFTV